MSSSNLGSEVSITNGGFTRVTKKEKMNEDWFIKTNI